MKKKFTLLFITSIFSWLLLQVNAQNNIGIQWQRTFGGSREDDGFSICKTSDGGFITAGSARSTDGNASTGNNGASDVWVIKYNRTGAIEWKKNYGGTLSEFATQIIETADGGYAFTATTFSNNGDVSGLKGNSDVWVVRLNSSGTILWKRTLGGTRAERSSGLVQANDGGLILGSMTESLDGDVVGHLPSGISALDYDLWFVKLKSNDTAIEWQRVINDSVITISPGIPRFEFLRDMVYLADGSILATGYIQGLGGGDYPPAPLRNQPFLIKIGANAEKKFVKLLGPLGRISHGIFTNSNNDSFITGSDSLLQNHIIKVDPFGEIIWQKSFRVTNDTFQVLTSIARSFDSRYFFLTSNSSNSGQTNALNKSSIIQCDTMGNVTWIKTITIPGFSNLYRVIIHSDSFPLAIGTYKPLTQQGGFDSSDMLLVKAGPANNVKGNLFVDVNTNGIKDNGEINFNAAIVKSQKVASVQSSALYDGNFSIDVDTGNYITSVHLYNPYYNVVPTSRNTNFTTYFNVDSFGFAIQPIPNKQDLQINLVPLAPARPGFKAQYVLNYKNVGTTTIANGSVKLIKDSRTTLSAALPVPSAIVADTLTWNYTNLKPLDSIAIGLEFQLAAPPVLNISDTLRYTAVILPVAGDLTPSDDTSSLRQRVIGSYDPNDKQESFAGKIPLKNVQDGSYINYVIRFQNTGNDTAFFVRLLDTLDAKLDWNSFQMIGSSHSYNLTIKDGNKLNWFFDNIKLPDSTTNRARSIGYVAFRIKPKNTLVANEVISNKASIYFDYNLPIVTNTTNTVVSVETTTAVREVQNDEMKMKLGPNPSNGYSVLQISGKLKGKFELRMIDANGRIISQQTITRNSTGEVIQLPLNLQQLSSGVYLIQLQQKEKSWWQKIVLQ